MLQADEIEQLKRDIEWARWTCNLPKVSYLSRKLVALLGKEQKNMELSTYPMVIGTTGE